MPADAPQTPPLLPSGPDTGLLTVHRPQGMIDLLRDYKISLDGQLVGRISAGSELTLTVPVGTHSLRASLDWCRSNELTITVRAGESTTVTVANSMAGWRFAIPFIEVLYWTIWRSRYLKLTEQGRGFSVLLRPAAEQERRS